MRTIAILALFAQSVAAQLASSRISVIPRADDSDTGALRFLELNSNGLEYVEVLAPAAINVNRTLRLPEENSTLLAQDSHVYSDVASDSFEFRAHRARGTIAAPAAVQTNDLVMRWRGFARDATTFVNVSGITSTVEDATTLATALNFETMDSTGAFGVSLSLKPDGHLVPIVNVLQDLGASTTRWRYLYGQTLRLDGGIIEVNRSAQTSLTQVSWTVGGLTSAPGAWSWSVGPDSSASATKFIHNSTDIMWLTETGRAKFYGDVTPDASGTRALGAPAWEWNNAYIKFIDLSGDMVPTVTGVVPLGSSILRYSKVWTVDLDISGTCVGCGTSGGGFGWINTDDYGTSSNCTVLTDNTTAINNAIAAATPNTGTKVIIPPGCYGVTGTITIPHGVTLMGAGGGLDDTRFGSTHLRWIGAAPGVLTTMVKLNGYSGGLRDLHIHAAGVSKVEPLKCINCGVVMIQNVSIARWNSGPAVEITTASGGVPGYGSCGSVITNLVAANPSGPGVGDAGASGLLVDGNVAGSDACSLAFIGGEFNFGSDTAGTYGGKARYADNISFLRTNFYRVGSGTQAGFMFEQYPSDTSFPKEIAFINSTVVNGFGGVPGTSGITVIGMPTDDCGGAACTPVITNIRGFTNLGTFGGFGPWFPHPNAGFPSLAIRNSNQNTNDMGKLSFRRGDNERAAIGTDYSAGLVFATTPGGQPQWQVNKGARITTAGTLVSISVSAGVATVSTSSAHGLSTGHWVRVFGCAAADVLLCGDYRITSVPLTTTFTYTTTAANGTYSYDDLVVEGAAQPRWEVNSDGNLLPSVDVSYSIGNTSRRPSSITSRFFSTYSEASYGTQGNTFSADANLNLLLDAYANGATDRGGYHMRRARNTVASPLPVASGDRLGTIAAHGFVTGSFFQPSARIDFYADTVSGTILATSIRMATMDNSGTLADRLTINPSGDTTFEKTVAATTFSASGNPALRVGGQTSIDSSRNIIAGNITPISAGVYDNGNSTNHWNDGWAFRWMAKTALFVEVSGVTRFSASGGGISTYSSGGALQFNVSNTSGNVEAAGTIRSNSAYIISGVTGTTNNLSCPAGQAIKAINVIGGIVVSVSCGAV